LDNPLKARSEAVLEQQEVSQLRFYSLKQKKSAVPIFSDLKRLANYLDASLPPFELGCAVIFARSEMKRNGSEIFFASMRKKVLFFAYFASMRNLEI
jgi:hypothetical protein